VVPLLLYQRCQDFSESRILIPDSLNLGLVVTTFTSYFPPTTPTFVKGVEPTVFIHLTPSTPFNAISSVVTVESVGNHASLLYAGGNFCLDAFRPRALVKFSAR
jgi:hypothetical protein